MDGVVDAEAEAERAKKANTKAIRKDRETREKEKRY